MESHLLQMRGLKPRLYLEVYNNQNQSEISNHKPLIVSTF